MLFETSLTVATLVLFAPTQVAMAGPPEASIEAPRSALPPLVALDGSPIDPSTVDGKAILFVNVASRCGFTGQYEGLQALYEAHKEDGLVIVGVPCNQFGGQEPGKPEEIASFCKMNYGVTFPLLEKQDVNGAKRSDLYRWLVGSGVGGDRDVRWNFEKFVVGRDGQVLARFASQTGPDDPELARAIDQALGR